MLPPVPSYDAAVCPHPLRRHQQEALDAVAAAEAGGSTRWWVTMPPGAGKTLVGTEVARRSGRRTVVLSPNTAVQQQWLRAWEAYDGPPAGHRRDLRVGFTSLTYQSLAVFDDPDEEAAGEAGGAPSGQLHRLHANGRELVEAMRDAGPLLVVLDECHHLLEVWGELLREVLAELPEATVLGLTATPPGAVTADQAALVEELFGPVLYEARIPALVKEGVLAPYAELAWVVSPTRQEAAWLDEQSTRFAELVADLFAPGFGSTPLPEWLRRRFHAALDEGTTWQEVSARDPALTDAVLRLAWSDLVELPPGATLRERHREAPAAEDWRLVVDDWLRGCVQPSSEGDGEQAAQDTRVLRAVADALPAIGYVWTRRGVRAGRGTVDRVTARSRAKEAAVTSIVGAELANLGERARALVLCDHERATATSRARARDAQDDEATAPPEPAGSATGVLAALLSDPVTAGLDPMLVTGRTVAGGTEALQRFLTWLGRTHPMLSGTLRVVTDGEVPRLEGRWTSSQWVGHVTAWFAEGGTQCLVGTRGLLGEGWDAPCVTTLVDLTTVTTPTAVVQTRGRALRLDPAHPDKVAQVWSVACVHDGHVAGANDWARLVRKHAGYFTVDEHGVVVDGVAGLDSGFSEFHAPSREEHDAIAARMLRRAEDRDATRAAWRDEAAYADRTTHVLRVRDTRAPAGTASSAPASRPTPWAEQRRERPGGRLAAVPPVVALVLVGLLALAGAPTWLLVLLGVVLLAAAGAASLALWGRAVLLGASQHHTTVPLAAAAVADGLRRAGLSPVGADAVRADVQPDGRTGYSLDGVDEEVSARFATSLEEVLSPMASPRYVVARHVTTAPQGLDGLRRGWEDRGRQRADGEVWHTVPSVLATHRARADAFAEAWGHWVGGGPALYAHGPEAAGVLATHRGEDPFAVTCVVRRVWE